MKFSVFLSGLLLLFLLPDWTESVEDNTVDINTLARIINFFEENYKRVAKDGYPLQYATAINVPKDQCQQKFNLNTFLTQEQDAVEVRKAIDDDSNALYEGQELIAAGNRKVKIKNKYNNMHSESLLLNPVDNSPMRNLLNKRKEDSCSVFYTFNSPCVQTCLDAEGPYNIINALKNWTKHDGIKAFVFKNFWKHDVERKDTKDLKTELKQIVAHVPLFRCVSETVCYACKGEGNTIDANCLPPPPPTTPEMINSEL